MLFTNKIFQYVKIKFLLIVCISSFFYHVGYGQCTTFTLSNNFTQAVIGQTVNLIWTTSCSSDQLLTIVLTNSACNCVKFQYKNVPNTGSFNFYIPTNMVAGLSGFYIQNNSPTTAYDYGPTFQLLGALPVVYERDLHAEIKNNMINMEWTTASESNNAGFEIQQSKDGVYFQKIGWIDGAGNSTEKKRYTFTDKNPNRGKNYYRLQQLDYDGEMEYSTVVSLTTASNDISIYPNPVSDILHVLGETDGRYHVKNILGQQLLTGIADSQRMDVSSLSSGKYILTIFDVNGKSSNHFILKE